MGGSGLEESGDLRAELRQRRLAPPGSGLLPRRGGHDLTWIRHCHRRQRRRQRDQLPHRLRQHAFDLVLLPGAASTLRAVRSALPLTFFHRWGGPAARTGSLLLLLARPLAAQTAVVSGAVTDSAGAPIEYARVRAAGTDLRALTDGAGRFRLARVRAGQVVLHVDRVGYRPVVDTLAVASGESLFVNVTLAAAARVTVTNRDR